MAELKRVLGFWTILSLAISSIMGTGLFFGNAIQFGANPSFLGTAGVIPLMNIAVGLEVFAALSIIVVLIFSSEAEK